MAVSAFKSTSRRGTPPTAPSTAARGAAASTSASAGAAGKAAGKPAPSRRSRSVSAFSRSQGRLDVDLDFANKRENPLYWAADVDSPRLDGQCEVKIAKLDGAGSRSKVPGGGGTGGGGIGGEVRRGRSVSRFSEAGGGKSAAGGGGGGRGVGRSLSRVDTGRRRRSVSRDHHGYSESERDQEVRSLGSRTKTGLNGSRSDGVDKSAIARSDSDLSELLRGYNTWSSQHSTLRASDGSAVDQSSLFLPHWEDGGSMSSFSDAEERKNVPVSEPANVMLRSRSSSTLSTENDMSLELVNPAGAELVTEVRGEYARRLEESQQRARKLRAELAVEEHRGVELNQILETIITDPETPDVKNARVARKASMERRKVSKRLEEEALAYFDECVSISTFDGSEFSSLEDPLTNVVVSAEQHGDKANLPGERASHSNDPMPDQNMEPSNPVLQNTTGVESPSASSLSSSSRNWKRRFSFADKRKDGSVLEQELKSYVNIFTKDGGRKDGNSSPTENPRRCDAGEYIFCAPAETFLHERVTFKKRIDSGGMHLCGCATVL